jgi:hypothetical protein
MRGIGDEENLMFRTWPLGEDLEICLNGSLPCAWNAPCSALPRIRFSKLSCLCAVTVLII